ncbi:uncharacterized protein LOC132630978 [Lycium barbarum]|uniref:uncharacterized protein LOC132630978 n=1 Tax=Lycium barbarum TaxID=112863 RepID=UPI00293EFDED|nr:uncharacterized protein LOC132630978 [Lycium barbarum]
MVAGRKTHRSGQSSLVIVVGRERREKMQYGASTCVLHLHTFTLIFQYQLSGCSSYPGFRSSHWEKKALSLIQKIFQQKGAMQLEENESLVLNSDFLVESPQPMKAQHIYRLKSIEAHTNCG